MYAWSLSGASFDESFRLEPAHLAGFPQSFRAVIPESTAGVGSVSGELLKVWGGAMDLKLASKTYLGLEGNGSQVQSHSTSVPRQSVTIELLFGIWVFWCGP